MNQPSRSLFVLVRQPSAFLPLLLSLAALSIVLGHAALYGVVHEPDEGAAAHLWQLLVAIQIPMITVFALKWLPRATRAALLFLALFALSTLANVAAVFFLT